MLRAKLDVLIWRYCLPHLVFVYPKLGVDSCVVVTDTEMPNELLDEFYRKSFGEVALSNKLLITILFTRWSHIFSRCTCESRVAAAAAAAASELSWDNSALTSAPHLI